MAEPLTAEEIKKTIQDAQASIIDIFNELIEQLPAGYIITRVNVGCPRESKWGDTSVVNFYKPVARITVEVYPEE